MKQIEIFPQIICSFDFGSHFSETEKKFFASFGKNVTNELGGNHLSYEKNILNYSEIRHIKNFIDSCLQQYVSNIIQPKNDISLYVTESWLSFTNKNERHHGHYHYNSLISGVFYINTVKNDTITFIDDKKRMLVFDGYENRYNCQRYNLPVNTGQLILFPSELEHETNEHHEDKTRISLAFNTFVKGNISNEFTWSLNI